MLCPPQPLLAKPKAHETSLENVSSIKYWMGLTVSNVASLCSASDRRRAQLCTTGRLRQGACKV